MKKQVILGWTDLEVDRNIKLIGTEFDRKRKFTDKQIAKAKKMLDKGKTFNEIASKLKVDVRVVRYHLDPTYRAMRISGAVTAGTNRKNYPTRIDEFKNRVNYKRELVARGRISI